MVYETDLRLILKEKVCILENKQTKHKQATKKNRKTWERGKSIFNVSHHTLLDNLHTDYKKRTFGL